MKLFLAIVNVLVAFSALICDPVRLYRKDAKQLTYPKSDAVSYVFTIPGNLPNSVIYVDPKEGFLDRFDTTNIHEANATHNFKRQIATICKNQAPDTVPLYRGFNNDNGLHMSSMDTAKLASKGYTPEKNILGYVYPTLPAQENTGFFQVYSVKIWGTEYMTSENRTEGSEIHGTIAEPLFFSMPLEPKLPTTTNLVCNPYTVNFTGCAFTSSNCPSSRCLTLHGAIDKAIDKGVAAFSFSWNFGKSFVNHGWSAVKGFWDLGGKVVDGVGEIIDHPVASAGFAFKLFLAAHDPIGTGEHLMKLIDEECAIEGGVVLKKQYDLLMECVTDVAQQVADFVYEKSSEERQFCFDTNATATAQCLGGATFEIGFFFSRRASRRRGRRGSRGNRSRRSRRKGRRRNASYGLYK